MIGTVSSSRIPSTKRVTDNGLTRCSFVRYYSGVCGGYSRSTIWTGVAFFPRQRLEPLRRPCGVWELHHDPLCTLVPQRFFHPAPTEAVFGQHHVQACSEGRLSEPAFQDWHVGVRCLVFSSFIHPHDGVPLQCQSSRDSKSARFMAHILPILRHHVHGGVWTDKVVLGRKFLSKLPNHGNDIPYAGILEHWVSGYVSDQTVTLEAHAR